MSQKKYMVPIVVLLVGLIVGAGLGYGSVISQTSSKDTQITSLQSQITNLQSQLSTKDTQISNLTAQVNNLKSQIPPVIKGDWNWLVNFTGSSGMDTGYFYVPQPELHLLWTWKSGTPQFAGFYLSLYKQGETTYTATFSSLQSRGDTYVHNLKPGYYYLKISEANIDSWGINVRIWVPS